MRGFSLLIHCIEGEIVFSLTHWHIETYCLYAQRRGVSHSSLVLMSRLSPTTVIACDYRGKFIYAMLTLYRLLEDII